MNRAAPILFILGLGLMALGVVVPLLIAGRSLYTAWQFKPYPKPYEARVVAFNEHTRRYTTTAPVVEIKRPDGTNFRFTSSHYSIFQPFGLSEKVQLVTRSRTDAAGRPTEIIEIDNAYHLWIGDCLAGLFLPFAFFVVWKCARFFPSREESRRYQLPL